MIALSEHVSGTVLPVRARPGARRDALVGEHAGALRVAVSAAPERGRANEAIRDVLALALGVRGSQVRLIAGETSREKKFLIEGIGPEALRARLAEALSGAEPGRGAG